ncbi:hypothetical protein GGR54DRAFT_646287 [Hypoxylon sp. NC1633]|nr:hypothetical protein GGR54DRAFT_646287 [Hypoxylon sp. NC1633]
MAPSLVVDCYNNDTYCMRMLQSLKFIVYEGGAAGRDRGCPLPEDQKYELHQGVFSTFPQKEEHVMGDLFEPHPVKPGLWRFRTRADDIISFTTAEKLNPSTMESTIQAHPLLKSAVVGGQGQFQASLLLEPREYPKNAAEAKAFIDQVWPSISQANRDCPAHGRIMKGFVVLTDPAKSLPRASKDTVQHTVQRHAVFKLYEAEWKLLYECFARSNQALKEPMAQPSAPSEKPNGILAEADDGAVLSDTIALAIEAIVERKLSAALDRFANALLAAASQLQSATSSASQSAAQVTESPATGSASPDDAVSVPEKTAEERLRQIIYDTLAENLEVDGLKDDTDLFKFGLDSLRALSLLNAINAKPDDFFFSVFIFATRKFRSILFCSFDLELPDLEFPDVEDFLVVEELLAISKQMEIYIEEGDSQ